MSSASKKFIGVIGAGSFGSIVANIIANRYDVLLYVRSRKTLENISVERKIRGIKVHDRVQLTSDVEKITQSCDVIFPIVPSANFRAMIQDFSPFLRPYHVLIHGTKGFDVSLPKGESLATIKKLERSQLKTMSEVIREESVVLRVGCLAGPNIARELAKQQPGATVVASPFKEVIRIGKRLLRNDWFQVYESNDLIGIEMAGILKNIIAIASGALSGMGYGDNSKGMLISRGAVEMIYLGRALGAGLKPFLGLAGIGDLVATCNSPMSRNFQVGYRLAMGETIGQIIADMQEVAEGVQTVQAMEKCAKHYKVHAPITGQLYKVLSEDMPIHDALKYLMRYPLNTDIDFF